MKNLPTTDVNTKIHEKMKRVSDNIERLVGSEAYRGDVNTLME